MASQGIYIAVLLCLAATGTQAKEDNPEMRVFTSPANTSVQLGVSSIFSIGVLALGLLALVAVFGFFSEEKEAASYYPPTSYTASAPSYSTGESSYSVLRSIDEAKDRYQWQHQ
ncbi:uncharacterized protein LOC122249142 [Penaeus japonicus]|uniref:uncharacterized protein LOC122249142 n=1 Tax=Penaeus japonicus TaxID=27405 RepID=UPI001C710348|nr:uncharacterized protein LOC122249142 [Penaeus japonicus]